MTSATGEESLLNPPGDLSSCDREPIHIPGSIQPHGVLLVLSGSDLTILQASQNIDEYFGLPVNEVVGRPVSLLLPEDLVRMVEDAASGEYLEGNPHYLFTIQTRQGISLDAVVHRFEGALILEMERTVADNAASLGGHKSGGVGRSLFRTISQSMVLLQKALTVMELVQRAAEEVRRLTGFDKVMVYRFDENWNGTVIGEDRIPEIEPYLGLRFPASDIPQQARRLYLLNKLRLIADVDYIPMPVLPAANPGTGQPLNLSYAALRSVSPIHIEYLKNMGVASSMSISIIKDGALWGLIACHHRKPKYLSYEMRAACEYLGETLALQISAKERTEDHKRSAEIRVLHSHLLEAMAGADNWWRGLQDQSDALLNYAGASGAALCFDGRTILMGNTPGEAAIESLLDWLWNDGTREIFATDSLSSHYPSALEWKDTASGLLTLPLSEIRPNFILWFRPEVISTVTWSGDPHKPVETPMDAEKEARIHPRKSFEAWKETVRLKSAPWNESDAEAALNLRNAITRIILRKAEELAHLHAELERINSELDSFSYSISHDLRAPFRHVTGFSELLRKRSGEQLDKTGLHYLDAISEAAGQAGQLVDNLLAFHDLRRAELRQAPVDMNSLVQRVVEEHLSAARDARRNEDQHQSLPHVVWQMGQLPTVRGDADMMRTIFRNLISNALKFSAMREPPVIEIGGEEREREAIFWVRDNGVGFDMEYSHKLFGVFQRLHTASEFHGLGIGLANVRRLVLRHGGRTWAEGEPGQGATFYISLPRYNSGNGST